MYKVDDSGVEVTPETVIPDRTITRKEVGRVICVTVMWKISSDLKGSSIHLVRDKITRIQKIYLLILMYILLESKIKGS